MSDEDAKSWIYAGGIPYELTEGDIICVFSQYGEIFEISLSRDKETGKSRGFCFIKYEDPRSCELAVDNLHGATIVGRKIKVSYANNTNAVRARKPAFIAPQEGSKIPMVDDSKAKRNYEKNVELFPRMLPPNEGEIPADMEDLHRYRDGTRSQRHLKPVEDYSEREHQHNRPRHKLENRYEERSDKVEDAKKIKHKSTHRDKDEDRDHHRRSHKHSSERHSSSKRSHKSSKRHHKDSSDSDSDSRRRHKKHKHKHKHSHKSHKHR